MPLVYIPDHLSPAVPSYGLGPTAPSCPSFRSPQASFHPADAIAARKQALLADFARSLDEQYPSTAPSPPVFGQYSQQHLRQQFLQQQQQQQQSYLAELERQRAEIALLEAVEEERTRQAVLRRQAAIASYEREQARQRAERQRQYEAEQEQQARLEALRQLSIRQQRQAIYEQQVAEKQRRHRQQQLAQQQQRQVRQQQPSLEDLLTLLAHAGRHQAKEQPSVLARAPAREPTTQPTGDDLPAAFEAFLGQLFGQHGEPSSSTTAKQPSSETPVDERSVKSQPPASYHYIPHPSVARSITHPASSSTPTPAPTPAPERLSTPPARATPAIAVSRSSSPARSSAASPPVTPHSKLSALFARLRSAASEANSLGELQHRLTTLLVEADAIEAGGDAAIRSRRKELVSEVEKVLGALERKEAARKEADSVTSDVKQVEEPAAPSAVSSAAPIAVEESVSTPSAGSDEVQPEDHTSPGPTESATATAPVFISIGSPAPSTSHVPPSADHDDDARSDASSIASPIVVTSELAQDNENDDDEARSVTSSRSSSSSRRGRKAYVEDAPEEDGFQVV